MPGIGRLTEPIDKVYTWDEFLLATKIFKEELLHRYPYLYDIRGVKVPLNQFRGSDSDENILEEFIDDTLMEVYGLRNPSQKFDHTKEKSVENWIIMLLASKVKNYKPAQEVSLETLLGVSETGGELTIENILPHPGAAKELASRESKDLEERIHSIIKESGNKEWLIIYDALLEGAPLEEMVAELLEAGGKAETTQSVVKKIRDMRSWLLEQEDFKKLFEPEELKKKRIELLKRTQEGREELREEGLMEPLKSQELKFEKLKLPLSKYFIHSLRRS